MVVALPDKLPAMPRLLGRLSLRVGQQLRQVRQATGAKLAQTRADWAAARAYEQGQRSLLDAVAPAWVEHTRDAYVVEGVYTRTLLLRAWPPHLRAGWLAPLFAVGDVSIAQHITPLAPQAAVRKLRAQRTLQTSVAHERLLRGAISDPTEQLALGDAERVEQAIAAGQARLFSVSLTLVLRAPTREALHALERTVRDRLAEVRAEPVPATWEHAAGFLAAGTPYGDDRLRRPRTVDTTALAYSFPFLGESVSMGRGAFWGIATSDRSPVLLDLYDTEAGFPAAHVVIISPTGNGKTVTAGHLWMEHATQPDPPDIIVIDPAKGDYRQAVDALGGQLIRLNARPEHVINPLDVPPAGAILQGGQGGQGGAGAPHGTTNPVMEHTRHVIGLLALMVSTPGQPMSKLESALAERAVLEAYAAAGIHSEDATTWTPPPDAVPTLHDVCTVLERLATDEGNATAASLAVRLVPYARGTLAGLFSRPTTLTLDRPLVSFDLEGLDSELRPLAVHTIAGYVWREARRERKRCILCLDEVKTLLAYPESARLVGDLYALGRSYGLAVWSMSQLLRDYTDTPEGDRAIENAPTVLLLRQAGGKPAVAAQERYRLTDDERLYLEGCPRGEGLLITPRGRVRLHIEPSPWELELLGGPCAAPAPTHPQAHAAPSGSEPKPNTMAADFDKTDKAILAGMCGLAGAATAPLWAVALPVWPLVRISTRRLPPLAPLVGAIATVGAGALVLPATGHPLLGFADLQIETARTLYDRALDAAVAIKGGTPGTSLIDSPALWRGLVAYAGQVWPYALPGGVALACAGESGRRVRLWRRTDRSTGGGVLLSERHPEAPSLPSKVMRLADAGMLPVLTRRRWGWLPFWRQAIERCLPLGYSAPQGWPVGLVTPAELSAHGLVVGMTGKGKTALMENLIRVAHGRLGWPVVCVDLKGSPALRRAVRALGGIVWTPRGHVRLDLLRGTVSDVAAKLVAAAGTVTGEQHNQQSGGYLHWAIKAMDAAGEGRSLPLLQRLLVPDALARYLESRVRPHHPELADRLLPEVEAFDALDALGDLAARLRFITEGDAAPALDSGPAVLDLEQAIRAGRLVLVSLPVGRYHLMGEKLGAWLLLEVSRVASRLTETDWGRRNGGTRCLFLVDEFAGLGAQGRYITRPLALVREGGVSIWLFTQTYANLQKLGDVARRDILGNCDVCIVFKQNEPDDREAWSAQFAEYQTRRLTPSVDARTGQVAGHATPREVRQRYVLADDFGALPVGHAYVRIGDRRPVAVRFPIPASAFTQPDEPDDGDSGDEDTHPPDRAGASTKGVSRPGQAPPQEPFTAPSATVTVPVPHASPHVSGHASPHRWRREVRSDPAGSPFDPFSLAEGDDGRAE